MAQRWVPLLVGLSFSVTALGEPYWIAWEGDDFPENQGWERRYGNWDGEWQGQANRTLENGILTIDSMHDDGVYDFYRIIRPGEIDPGQGETFVAEWRMKVEDLAGAWRYDPQVAIASDSGWNVGLNFNVDTVQASYSLPYSATFAPDEYHTFRFETTDMRTYNLYIDGAFGMSGEFKLLVSQSRVGWGDGWQGAASRTQWDYLRFGVVPEPSSGVSTALAVMLIGRSRS